jgi:hypothetical protein
MAKKKIRPLGDVTADMEPLLFEMSLDHDLQHGEVLAKIYSWLKIHVPGQAEKYLTGGKPNLPKIFDFEEHKNERRNKRTKAKSKSS